MPELRLVKHYHDDAGYISALAQRVNDHWMVHGRPDKLVLSFHGVPQRSLALGDPYHCECLKTGRLLAERLKLREDFGRRHLPEPLRQGRMAAALHRADAGGTGARQGIARVDVMCPGFMADCLETLEEIDQEARAAYLVAGGKGFGYIPCLNDQHEWIAALAGIAIRHLQGWDTAPANADAPELQVQRRRASTPARHAERLGFGPLRRFIAERDSRRFSSRAPPLQRAVHPMQSQVRKT